MKKLIVFSVLFFAAITLSLSQTNYTEVVYLKNGNKVKGVILEQIPNDKLKIQSEDGSTFVFKYTEIEKITKEPIAINKTTTNTSAPSAPAQQTINNTNYYAQKSGNGGMVMNGTPLIIKLTNTVSSANTDMPMFVINGDVKDNMGNILISDGTQVNTETKIKKRRSVGIAGKIEIKFLSTTGVDGQMISLTGNKNYAAEDKKGKVIGVAVGVGWFIFPMFAYLAKKGDDIEVPAGTMLTNSAIVAGTYTIK